MVDAIEEGERKRQPAPDWLTWRALPNTLAELSIVAVTAATEPPAKAIG